MLATDIPNPDDIFHPGQNCWRVEQADHISILVDYGNYYRDLHQSIVKAKHSIFILGWDIDSRIELLRGKDADEASAPARFFDLICWKAHQNPEVQIYLNKWNYSIFFFQQREPFWKRRWRECGLKNVHFVLDGMIPTGACHHQKVVVVDDETAFWGGMDVALGRWDFRQHHVENPHRADPSGLPNPHKHTHYSPYHDIQAVMSGPAATALAQLVRERWAMVCDTPPVPIRYPATSELPPSWPQAYPSDFENVPVVISRTLPGMMGTKPVQEIKQLILDEISLAEKFIYIENQFLCCDNIARALNKRLHERPELRVLALSCYDPQGIMERKSMWAGRVRFRDLIEAGGVGDRVAMAYPSAKEHGKHAIVRIHSKLMIIDDKWMRIGSANFNNRSMGLDTECDITIIGAHEAARNKITAVRNDLIREHCGRSLEDISNIIDNNLPVKTFLQALPTSHQDFKEINDEKYRNESFQRIVKRIADSEHPLIRSSWTTHFHHGFPRRNFARSAMIAVAALAMVAAVTLMWKYTPLAKYASVESLSALIEKSENSPWALLWVTLIYVLGGIFFFPVTVMSGAVIGVFGGMKGLAMSLVGATVSSIVGYKIGNLVGLERISKFSSRTHTALEKIKGSGVVGVAVVRTVPVAPFSLVNLLFGVSGIPLLSFVLGTVLGLLPGKITLALLGDSLKEAFKNPQPKNIALAVAGFIAWVAVMFICNRLAKKWQDRKASHQGAS